MESEINTIIPAERCILQASSQNAYKSIQKWNLSRFHSPQIEGGNSKPMSFIDLIGLAFLSDSNSNVFSIGDVISVTLPDENSEIDENRIVELRIVDLMPISKGILTPNTEVILLSHDVNLQSLKRSDIPILFSPSYDKTAFFSTLSYDTLHSLWLVASGDSIAGAMVTQNNPPIYRVTPDLKEEEKILPFITLRCGLPSFISIAESEDIAYASPSVIQQFLSFLSEDPSHPFRLKSNQMESLFTNTDERILMTAGLDDELLIPFFLSSLPKSNLLEPTEEEANFELYVTPTLFRNVCLSWKNVSESVMHTLRSFSSLTSPISSTCDISNHMWSIRIPRLFFSILFEKSQDGFHTVLTSSNIFSPSDLAGGSLRVKKMIVSLAFPEWYHKYWYGSDYKRLAENILKNSRDILHGRLVSEGRLLALPIYHSNNFSDNSSAHAEDLNDSDGLFRNLENARENLWQFLNGVGKCPWEKDGESGVSPIWFDNQNDVASSESGSSCGPWMYFIVEEVCCEGLSSFGSIFLSPSENELSNGNSSSSQVLTEVVFREASYHHPAIRWLPPRHTSGLWMFDQLSQTLSITRRLIAACQGQMNIPWFSANADNKSEAPAQASTVSVCILQGLAANATMESLFYSIQSLGLCYLILDHRITEEHVIAKCLETLVTQSSSSSPANEKSSYANSIINLPIEAESPIVLVIKHAELLPSDSILVEKLHAWSVDGTISISPLNYRITYNDLSKISVEQVRVIVFLIFETMDDTVAPMIRAISHDWTNDLENQIDNTENDANEVIQVRSPDASDRVTLLEAIFDCARKNYSIRPNLLLTVGTISDWVVGLSVNDIISFGLHCIYDTLLSYLSSFSVPNCDNAFLIAKWSAIINSLSRESQQRMELVISEKRCSDLLSKFQRIYGYQMISLKLDPVYWSDVGGLEDAKREIIDLIELPQLYPELFAGGQKKRTGILFFGPPGCGKTLLAKAVATEMNMNFMSVKGPELLNPYVGESERQIRNLFQRARDHSPCVLFFDELDSLAPARGANGDAGGVMDRIVSQLLVEIDGMQSRRSDGTLAGDVFILGATNRPDLLDPVLLRPGRLDRLCYLGVPSTNTEQLLAVKALTRNFHLDENVDLEAIIKPLPFLYSGADFFALCSDAMMGAVDEMVSGLSSSIDSHTVKLQQSIHETSSDMPSSGDEQEVNNNLLQSMESAELENPQGDTQDTSTITVFQHHFLNARENLRPSVTSEMMAYYENVKNRYK